MMDNLDQCGSARVLLFASSQLVTSFSVSKILEFLIFIAILLLKGLKLLSGILMILTLRSSRSSGLSCCSNAARSLSIVTSRADR